MAELPTSTQTLYLLNEKEAQDDGGAKTLALDTKDVRLAESTLLRLSIAHELLTSSDLNIGDIAQLCNFSSTSHFIRTFRKKHGITPAKWRKRAGS